MRWLHWHRMKPVDVSHVRYTHGGGQATLILLRCRGDFEIPGWRDTTPKPEGLNRPADIFAMLAAVTATMSVARSSELRERGPE